MYKIDRRWGGPKSIYEDGPKEYKPGERWILLLFLCKMHVQN